MNKTLSKIETYDGSSRLTRPHPLVSVVIPSYDRLQVLPRAIKSVLGQSYSNYEIIVVDDGSRDGTASWVETHVPTARLIRLPKNTSCAHARNTGFKAAKGSLIAFLDSDDAWKPEFLETCVNALQSHPQAGLAFSNYYQVNLDGASHVVSRSTHQAQYTDAIHQSLFEPSFIKMFVMFPKKALDEMRGFNERYRCLEDRELFLRMFLTGRPMVHVPQALGFRYASRESLSRNPRAVYRHAVQLLDTFLARPEGAGYRRFELAARKNALQTVFNRFMGGHHTFVSKLKCLGVILGLTHERPLLLNPQSFWAIPGIKGSPRWTTPSVWAVRVMVLNWMLARFLRRREN